MTNSIDPFIARYGTDEIPTAPLLLNAGPMTAELEAGNLRHIRYNGLEIIRAVSFIARDRNWGTYQPEISKLQVEQNESGFRVSYEALVGDDQQQFRYSALISGTAQSLSFEGSGTALTDFLTNRTGFVVLHPLSGVVGNAVSIERVDGTTEDGHFPVLIDPVQPMMNLRALTHQPVDGLSVRCQMDGDTFEMEDQRNWTDASYKTYVRPLAEPWPYTLAKDQSITQCVTLTVDGTLESTTSGTTATTLTLGPPAESLPKVGVGLPCEQVSRSLQSAALFQQLGADHFIVHFDESQGHTLDNLRDALTFIKQCEADAWLEVVVQSIDEFELELERLGQSLAQMETVFSTVLVSPAPDLKCTLPGSIWPEAPDANALYQKARQAFPQARIGGGMFSLFTELNRKRPPLEHLDLMGYTTTAILHAGDDQTIMENIYALPFVGKSARHIAGDLPISVGPSAIGLRMNPYGDAPFANPDNIRQAMNHNDPRQRGLLGAAWMVGYHAKLSPTSEAIAYGATMGATGIVYTSEKWPQPGFETEGEVFPLFHVLRALSRLSGRQRLDVVMSTTETIECIACQGDAAVDQPVELLIANMSPERQQVHLPGSSHTGCVLDEHHFRQAAGNPAFMDNLLPLPSTELTLDGYAVARVQCAG